MGRDRRGRFVVYPVAEIFHATPIELLGDDATAAELGAAVRRALAAEPDPEAALELHRAELRRLGLTLGELDGRRGVSVDVERKRLRLVAWDERGFPEEETPTLRRDADDETLGATILELLGEAKRVEGPVGAPFGYKLAWLAVRGADTDAVVEALGLERTEPATWEDGVSRASGGDAVFVSPRTGGWVFAVHTGWLDGPPDLAALSERLGTEVQYFATHRVVELHAWARAEGGRVTRSFRELGETGETEATGEPTPAERDIGFPDEETAMQIAAAWSIDPRTLGSVPSESETGILGFLR